MVGNCTGGDHNEFLRYFRVSVPVIKHASCLNSVREGEIPRIVSLVFGYRQYLLRFSVNVV